MLLTSACSKTVDGSGPTSPGPGASPRDFELSKNPLAGNSSDKFQKTPDNTKIVFIADEDTAGQNELYVVGLEGGKTKISPAMIPDGDVISFAVSPNSQKVAFLMDKDQDGRVDLYTVNLDGTDLAKVNIGVPSSAHTVIDSYKFMPNSLKLVYVTDEQETVGNKNLYIANLDGSSRLKLNTNSPGNGYVNGKFEINSSGRIVYGSVATGSNGEWIMNSVLGDATSYRRLSGLSSSAANTVYPDSFVLSPNGLKVVYLTSIDDVLKNELYSQDIESSYPTTSVKISGTIVANGNVDGFALIPFQITPDSSKVVFVADKDVDNRKDLYSVGITGTGLVKINGSGLAASDVKGFKIGANSDDVVYIMDADSDEVNELYATKVSAAAPVKVNSALSGSEDVLDYLIDTASGRVLYIHNKGGSAQLYTNVLAGSGETSISGISTVAMYDQVSSKVNQIQISSGRVFFRNGVSDSTLDLYSSNVDGSDLRRAHDIDHSGDVLIADSLTGQNYVVAGNHVVYRVNKTGKKTLYSSKF